jgi:hypothetical protein
MCSTPSETPRLAAPYAWTSTNVNHEQRRSETMEQKTTMPFFAQFLERVHSSQAADDPTPNKQTDDSGKKKDD